MLWLIIKIFIFIAFLLIILLIWPILLIAYCLHLYNTNTRISDDIFDISHSREFLKGKIGEAAVSNTLNKIDGNKKIINNVFINDNGKSRQIDHIFINQNGVFVIETKNFAGSIYGKETSNEWKQYINRRENRFKNPIFQNYAHKKIVSKVLGDDKNVISVVVFTDECKLKVTTPRNAVMYVSQLTKYIENQSVRLSDSKIEEYYNEIMENRITDEETIRNHKSNVQQYVAYNNKLVERNKCPRCDTGKLVLKKGKYGEFLGCTNYPECKYTKQIQNKNILK